MESSCSYFSLWNDQGKINRLQRRRRNKAEMHTCKTYEVLGNDY
jgi:hypothetical protein